MNKYVVFGAVLVAGLAITTSAFAAVKFGSQFPRAEIVSIVEVPGKKAEAAYKFKDGAVSCYVYGASISCVK